MVACGDEVVVMNVCNVVAMDDVTVAYDAMTADGVMATDDAGAMVVVWVQQCWMRACTNL